MSKTIASITINKPAAEVWKGLTDPALVKQYMFGTNMAVTQWHEGGNITYSGEWEGTAYEDKGTILQIKPNKFLKTTYFSSMSGLPDVPENYQIVSYKLDEVNGATTLTISQEGGKSEDEAKDQSSWNGVLESLKALLEK